MPLLLVAVLPTLRSALRFRRDLMIENLALASNSPRCHPARRLGVLDPAAPTLEWLGREPRHRPAEHGRAAASRRLPDLQELLDRVIVLNEHHLRQLLGSFIGYYKQDRTHLSICKDSPVADARSFGPPTGSSDPAAPILVCLGREPRHRQPDAVVRWHRGSILETGAG